MTDHFIETGTWKCNGVNAALKAGFPQITTIEYMPNVYEEAKKMVTDPKVRFLLGDSAVVMKDTIVPELNENDQQVTFWLDAHFQGRGQHGAKYPIKGELKAMANLKRKDHIVLIDDRRKFKKYRTSGREVTQLLKNINPEYVVGVMPGFVGWDVMFAATKEVLDAYSHPYVVSVA